MKLTFIMKFKYLVLAVLMVVFLAACGGGSGSTANTDGSTPPVTSGSSTVTGKITGTVATGSPVVGGTVIITDGTGATKTVTTDNLGAYSVDVTGMTAPFVMKATWTDVTVQTLLSAVTGVGTANINPLTNIAVLGTTGTPAEVVAQANTNLVTLASKLSSYLTQFSLAGVNPVTEAYILGKGFDKLFDSISFTVNNGVITATSTYDDKTVMTGKIGDLTNINTTLNLTPVEDGTVKITGVAFAGSTNYTTTAGTLFTINGSGFGTVKDSNTVMIGGTKCFVYYQTATQLKGYVSGVKSGTLAVVRTVPDNSTVPAGVKKIMATAPEAVILADKVDYSLWYAAFTPTGSTISLSASSMTAGTYNVIFADNTGKVVFTVPTVFSSTTMGVNANVSYTAPISPASVFTVHIESLDGKMKSNSVTTK